MGKHLVDGTIYSCGCYQKKQLSQRCKELGHKARKYFLEGQQFGELTVLKEDEGRDNCGAIVYTCQCSCGAVIHVPTQRLVTGHTKSCGCIKSYGEKTISLLLSNNKIPFSTQKTFETCIFPETHHKAKFDFYIEDQNYLIEYDGIQHFEYIDTGWRTKANYETTIKRDNFKNQWCKNNHIPLIRIPYTHLENLRIEDLKLETTSFLV